MADKKISALPAATALAGTEVVPVVQSGATKKATIDQILAPAAGKGIDFSANSHAAGMTSELLNDYEEGTWTPSDGSGAGLSFSVIANTCFYTKVGNLVTCTFAFVYPATASASSATITGLPFTAKATGNSVAGGPVTYCDAGFALTQLVSPSATSFGLWTTSGGVVTNLQMSGRPLRGVIQYMV